HYHGDLFSRDRMKFLAFFMKDTQGKIDVVIVNWIIGAPMEGGFVALLFLASQYAICSYKIGRRSSQIKINAVQGFTGRMVEAGHKYFSTFILGGKAHPMVPQTVLR